MYSLCRSPLRIFSHARSYSTARVRSSAPRMPPNFLVSNSSAPYARWNSTKTPFEDLPTQPSPNSNDNTASTTSSDAPVLPSKPAASKKAPKPRKSGKAATQDDTGYIDLFSMSPAPELENRAGAQPQKPSNEAYKSQKSSANAAESEPSLPPNPWENFEKFNPTKPESETVYVGNLFWDLEAEDLRKHFEQFGTVLKTIIVHDARGISKGFGYVQFSTTEEAANAIEKQHLKVFGGRQIVLQFARAPVVRTKSKYEKPTNTLFVGNIPYELTDRDLQELFSNIFDVVDIRIPVDRRNGSMRGFAHVEFLNVKAACEGKEILSNKRPYNRRLLLEFSDSKRAAILDKSQGDIMPQGEPDMQQPEPEEPVSAAENARRRKEARVAAEEQARIEERVAARLAAAHKTGSSGDA